MNYFSTIKLILMYRPSEGGRLISRDVSSTETLKYMYKYKYPNLKYEYKTTSTEATSTNISKST